MLVAVGALVVGLTARTGSFTPWTAAIMLVYLLWPALLLLVGALLAASFTLFVAGLSLRIAPGHVVRRTASAHRR